MVRHYQLEHKADGEWKKTPHVIKIVLPSAAGHILNWNSLDEDFRAALLSMAREDELINYEESRVTLTCSDS